MSESKTASLVAMAIAIAPLEQALIDSLGMVTPLIDEMIVVKDVQLPGKVDAYAAILRRGRTIHAEYLADLKLREAIANGLLKTLERLEENVCLAMEELMADELSGFDTTFKLQANPPSVFIESEEAVPAEYKSTVTTTKVDKRRLAEDMKIGVPVTGARLVRTRRLVSRVKRREIA